MPSEEEEEEEEGGAGEGKDWRTQLQLLSACVRVILCFS